MSYKLLSPKRFVSGLGMYIEDSAKYCSFFGLRSLSSSYLVVDRVDGKVPSVFAFLFARFLMAKSSCFHPL